MADMKFDAEISTRLVGTASSGIHKRVAEQAGRRIERWLTAHGKPAKVQTLRFLPSSKAKIDSGFQVVANTTFIRMDAGQKADKGSDVVESVVTVDSGEKGRQVLRDVRIPLLELG